MIETKYLAVAGIIIVVIAAIGIYLAIGGGDSDESLGGEDSINVTFEYNNDIRLAIFGNANGDDYLDESDIELLESIIAGDVEYDPVLHCFADTNADGKLDQDDVDLLRTLVNGEEGTMYYWSAQEIVDSIDYPLGGNIGTHHMYAIDVLIILGLYDNVVGTSHQTFQNSIATDGLRYPGMGTTIADVGSPWEDCEAAVNAGINVWIDASSSTSRDYSTHTTIANAAGLNLQVIRLNITTYDSGSPSMYGTILMLGVMFQCEEAAHEFIEWGDGVRDYINSAVSNLNEDWTFLTPMGTTSSNDISLDTTYTDGSMMGDVYTISLTGMVSVNTVVDSGCPAISLEEIYNLDPDVIVIIMFQTSDVSVEDIQRQFDAYAEIYSYTNAYQNGQIYGVNYYNIASTAGLSELVLLSSYIWPEIFEEGVGWEYLEYYYDNFTMYENADVSTMGNAIPYRMSWTFED